MEGFTDSTMWTMILVVSLVGIFTKLAYYNVGKLGRDSALEHIPRITPERWESLEATYTKRGSVMLLLASIPIIGSAITAAAGAFETRLATFVILVLISNLIRNCLLVFVFGQTLALLPISG
jgi:membrane protein YqaA with SNARE-associated domain